MITRLRLVVLVIRPAVLVLLAMFTAIGLAQAGRADNALLLTRALIAVTGFLLFSVACNDLADEAIDRVNLPGRRPLVAGAITRRKFTIIGLAAGAAALGASATLHWPAVIVTAAGLCVSAAYSLRPVRLAERGALAALVLPAGYVAVPYLVGILAVRSSVRPRDLLLLAGLYLGFIGRILLKDFRDVRGDALFGKRTFLVRHGRQRTCQLSACGWLAGTCAILAAAGQPAAMLIITEIFCLAAAHSALHALSTDRGLRRDEALISAIAILGRGMMVMLLVYLSMRAAGWPGLRENAMLAGLCLVTGGQALSMARHGPQPSRLTVPAAIAAPEPPGTGLAGTVPAQTIRN